MQSGVLQAVAGQYQSRLPNILRRTNRNGNPPRHDSAALIFPVSPGMSFNVATAARSLSGFGGRGENSAVRGQIFADLRVHSGAMGQESAEIWTAQPNSQAGQPKSDRLLGLP